MILFLEFILQKPFWLPNPTIKLVLKPQQQQQQQPTPWLQMQVCSQLSASATTTINNTSIETHKPFINTHNPFIDTHKNWFIVDSMVLIWHQLQQKHRLHSRHFLIRKNFLFQFLLLCAPLGLLVVAYVALAWAGHDVVHRCWHCHRCWHWRMKTKKNKVISRLCCCCV